MCFRHATLSHGPCACTSCSHDERKGTGSHDLLSSSHTREPFLYRAMPEEHVRVFLFTSTQQMDAMLKRANQGRLTTAIAVKQLWDAHRTNWMEVRRLEVELGEGGDHDQPYDGYLPLSSSQELD